MSVDTATMDAVNQRLTTAAKVATRLAYRAAVGPDTNYTQAPVGGYVQEEGDGLKPTNPKDIIGGDKVPFHLWPETATIMGALGLLDGALKYGRANWRVAGVRTSIYYDALRRHMNKIFEGEELDPDSGLPHYAHALACLAILVDAKAAGLLVDDANYPGGYTKLLDEMTPHVKRLKAHHKDKHPHHYTAKDAGQTGPDYTGRAVEKT